MTSTLSRWASDSSIISWRSSSVKSGSPFCGLRIVATTTSSKRCDAVSMISTWPLWIGSNEPGYRTLVTRCTGHRCTPVGVTNTGTDVRR